MEGTVVLGDIQGRVEDASDAGTAAEGVRDAGKVVEAPGHSDEVPDDSKGVTSADVVPAEAQQRRARKPPKSPPKVKTTHFLSQPSADVPTFRSKYPGIVPEYLAQIFQTRKTRSAYEIVDIVEGEGVSSCANYASPSPSHPWHP